MGRFVGGWISRGTQQQYNPGTHQSERGQGRQILDAEGGFWKGACSDTDFELDVLGEL